MPLHPTHINVLPNPYCATDGEGRPVGICSCDPDMFGSNWLGGTIDIDATNATVEKLSVFQRKQRSQSMVAPRQSVLFKFDTEPLAVKFTGEARYFIAKKIRQGELLAADREAAKEAGVKFVEPSIAQAKALGAAREKFDALYGAGSFDMLARERGEISEPEPDVETDKSRKSSKNSTPKGD